jgi:hypothetical protein
MQQTPCLVETGVAAVAARTQEVGASPISVRISVQHAWGKSHRGINNKSAGTLGNKFINLLGTVIGLWVSLVWVSLVRERLEQADQKYSSPVVQAEF